NTPGVGMAAGTKDVIQDHLLAARLLDVLQGRERWRQIASDDTAHAQITCVHGLQACDNIDEVSEMWRCCAPIIRESRENALQIVQQALLGTVRLSGRIGKAKKVRAHHLTVRIPCLTGDSLELRLSFLEAAKHH